MPLQRAPPLAPYVPCRIQRLSLLDRASAQRCFSWTSPFCTPLLSQYAAACSASISFIGVQKFITVLPTTWPSAYSDAITGTLQSFVVTHLCRSWEHCDEQPPARQERGQQTVTRARGKHARRSVHKRAYSTAREQGRATAGRRRRAARSLSRNRRGKPQSSISERGQDGRSSSVLVVSFFCLLSI